MRLLNTCTGELKEFISDDEIPPYTIVSHTWEDDEISYQDWQTIPATVIESKAGYRKIRYSCTQAMKDGLEWIWIDTCCIDKTSSAELSQAINSMFRCRWFTRGWTLQELIAPTNLVFYTSDWNKLGSKSQLYSLISDITRIDGAFLNGEDLDTASVSKRMSWAAHRKTSRTEDIAYCLLGIFDVNMPLIYGEGDKAFCRLQQEIMKIYPHDHTLYAWGEVVLQSSLQVPNQGELWKNKKLPWNSNASKKNLLHGLLAQSPQDFESSGSFEPDPRAARFYKCFYRTMQPASQFGKGIRIDLPLFRVDHLVPLHSVYYWDELSLVQHRRLVFALLICGCSSRPSLLLAIPLQPWGDAGWGRTHGLVTMHDVLLSLIDQHIASFYIEPQIRERLQDGNLVFRSIKGLTWDPYQWVRHRKDAFFVEHEMMFRVNNPNISGRFGAFDYCLSKSENNFSTGFRITFGRTSSDGIGLGPFFVDIVPLVFSTHVDAVKLNGITWYNDTKPLDKEMMPLHSRTMQSPVDDLTLQSNLFPRIYIRTERMALGNGWAVDVVDIIIGEMGNENGESGPTEREKQVQPACLSQNGSKKQEFSRSMHDLARQGHKRLKQIKVKYRHSKKIESETDKAEETEWEGFSD